jgi:predicted NBD/HSP70 family sugar kinase
MSSVIGVDIGGTKSALARYDMATHAVQQEAQMPTDASRGLPAVIDAVVPIIQSLRSADTCAVGLGIAGLVRQPEGVVEHAPNIPGGERFPLRNVLTEKLGFPVFVANDAQCFTLAEALGGAGKGRKVVVGIAMGTGVGGGIVIDGKIVHGARGFAGEIGHMLLLPGQPPYPSKHKRGEVEEFLSGTAMGKRCEAAEKPEDYLEGKVCALLQPHVFEETAWLCASLAHAIDPDIIVFGGSAGRALKPHLGTIRKNLGRWVFPNTPLPDLAIGHRKDAATLGAALLAISS